MKFVVKEQYMQFGRSVRSFSLGLATASFIFVGTALAQTTGAAQSTDQTGQAQAQSGQSWDLVGVNARLDHALDTKSAKQGETVMARLDGTVTTAGGVKLEKGTQLTGTVSQVEAAANGGPSSLTLVFTTAQTKDGKQIPVKVTLLSAFPANTNTLATYGEDEVGSAPRYVNSQESVDQESGTLNNIAMQARVQGQNSGTFTKNGGNLKLEAGTYFQVGIAPTNGNATSNGE
jgi:hypothetical protein